jgi:hypothetical protein
MKLKKLSSILSEEENALLKYSPEEDQKLEEMLI